MIYTMLHFVRSYSLYIWRIEQYVCFLPLWFSKPTISSTVITFLSVRVCFSLAVSCFWSVLRVSQISVNNIPTLSLLQFIFKNSASIFRKLFFEPVQVLNRSLVSIAKWHITSPVYRRCIKSYYFWQYHLLLFTNIRNVCKIKHNLIIVWKLAKIVSEDDLLLMYYIDFGDFRKFVLHGSVATQLKCGWDI